MKRCQSASGATAFVRLMVATLAALALTGATSPSCWFDLLSSSRGQAQAGDGERQISPLPAATQEPNASYALERRPSRTIAATYTYSVSVPQLTAAEWELFAPEPVNLPGQDILHASTSPEAVVISDASELRQPLFRARVPAASPTLRREITLSIEIDARLFARRLISREGPAQAAQHEALSEQQRSLALRATSQFDYPSESVREWLIGQGLLRGAREGDVDYARRVFQVIARHFGYDYRGEQNRAASYVCAVGKSDCGGLAALFVSALRSQGVPARTLAGRWAMSARPGQRIGAVAYFQEHVKAEFFAQGVGWVPVDLSSAVLHDQTSEKLRFFGDDPGDFVTFHLDTGLVFDTRRFGRKTYTLLQRPSYWVAGSGSMQGVVTREDWTVRSAGPFDPPPRSAVQPSPFSR
jgi:transglutaminase-like putative cysteine protease